MHQKSTSSKILKLHPPLLAKELSVLRKLFHEKKKAQKFETNQQKQGQQQMNQKQGHKRKRVRREKRPTLSLEFYFFHLMVQILLDFEYFNEKKFGLSTEV
jgi:hypothetical protein